MRLTNDFSWSFSRANTFSECQKKYWYIYYGSWEGWPKTPYDKRPSIDPLASYLYAMKQMQRIPTFVGSVVHNTIEHFLKQKVRFTEEALIAYGKLLFERGISEAQSGAWRASPKKHANLFEYYYGTGISEEELERALKKVTDSLTNWYRSQIVQSLLFHDQTEQISVEELTHFQLADKFKIIVVMDLALAWKKKEGTTYILFDWKTGEESEKTEKQLYCYALYAHKVWKAPLDQMILVPFYVYKNVYQKIQGIDEEKLKVVEDEIVASCNELFPLHQKDPREFPYTSDRTKCQSCPFKELCTKADYKEVSQDELRAIK